MIVHKEIIQGTPEWLKLRVGKVTMSNLHKIITPAKGEPSAQQDGYMNEMLAELFYGEPIETFTSAAMQDGINFEEEAARIYSVENDCELEKIGFVTNDAGTIGCSPDRFIVGTKKAVEIKVPLPKTHVGYLRTKSVDKDYLCQLQGQLWVAELDKIDIYSYNPKMPRVQIEVGRDESFIAKAKVIVGDFLERFEQEKKRLNIKDLSSECHTLVAVIHSLCLLPLIGSLKWAI